jgi:hypothetical protein
MEEKGKNTEKGKIIFADFKSEPKIQTTKPAKNSPHQTNPILNRLFKLTHTELSKHSDDYRSFSKFNPDDLR